MKGKSLEKSGLLQIPNQCQNRIKQYGKRETGAFLMTPAHTAKWDHIVDALDSEGSALSVSKVLRYVSEETASKRFAGFEHTIWEILYHMNYWQNMLLRVAKGEAVDVSYYVEAESWLDQKELMKDTKWEREKGRFFDGLEEVEAMLNSSSADLLRPLPALPDKNAYNVLNSIILHNSYHTGQIVQLRKAAGLWVDPNTFTDAVKVG